MPSSLLVVFPHQLFADHPALRDGPRPAALIEDSLFFGDAKHPARFHKQKLRLHRSTMKRYEARLGEAGCEVTYHGHEPGRDPLSECIEAASSSGVVRIVAAEVHDHLLERRIRRLVDRLGLELEIVPTPMFLNTDEDNRSWREGRKRWFMADFYKHQRRRLGILMDGEEPEGGRWSFDEDNRKKIPKAMMAEIPAIPTFAPDAIEAEAGAHVEATYEGNPGRLGDPIYPTSHEEATAWLQAFLEQRLPRFGDYEDAIAAGENWLWHGVLTPMLNIGLLTPGQVVDATLGHAGRHDIPLNSLEGFVRQVVGWREFMRATYVDLGVRMRTTNHWGHHRPMPEAFYDGTTGIEPVDDVIRRVLDTGYCHHIERLMVLGGFMFLCEIDPDEIYRWFMEMFVDSYDWVMVPNVYAMSQNADGGLITTKPYFSGSAYVKKMSNHRNGDWNATWDGLYWRWILDHADELGKNPRWAMMCASAKRMDPAKQATHRANAESFLAGLA
ncbi:MAG: cryptochrome/photolyase family protein [Planctomycetaceae bacterium]|nr:cryptochrome/photolyase family protein [Planctomycetaceae bacterium]